MPIYTYECETCGERFESRQSFADEPLSICPTCTGKIHRVIQPAGIVFKGSGFYVTDNRGKQTLATPGTKKEDTKSTEGGANASSDGGSSESKSLDGGENKSKAAANTETSSKTSTTSSSSESSKSTSGSPSAS